MESQMKIVSIVYYVSDITFAYSCIASAESTAIHVLFDMKLV
jgi:hypothetical protein